MYEVADDTYCYPGTTVLKNLLGLKEQAELDAFEAEITVQRASEPMPEGKLDAVHYKAIHRYLFQDVYIWAGKPRTVRISKGGNALLSRTHRQADGQAFCSAGRQAPRYAESAVSMTAEQWSR